MSFPLGRAEVASVPVFADRCSSFFGAQPPSANCRPKGVSRSGLRTPPLLFPLPQGKCKGFLVTSGIAEQPMTNSEKLRSPPQPRLIAGLLLVAVLYSSSAVGVPIPAKKQGADNALQEIR